ncbi:Zinc-binding protein [Quillaja saponaria]|uniref:Zinc-binding protein n=1 Tax=Quillaja saponaria TaxID=32244 RepID=A0AAD7P723_QUISA|nr:Zinc-binding protein [Quillaja saponaria]
MGGGNGQKAKMAREKNLEKQKGSKGSQLDTNKKAMSIQVNLCFARCVCTTSEVKCREHAEAKHPKFDVHTCFPHLKNEDMGELQIIMAFYVNLSTVISLRFYYGQMCVCVLWEGREGKGGKVISMHVSLRQSETVQ